MLVIRMRRTGSKKRPHYRVVVTERRSPREGGFLETLGFYDPRARPAVVDVDTARIAHWIARGARPSDSVRTLLKRHVSRDRSAAAPVAAAPAAPPV
jgi:small subunit ribosomal protein S16